MVWPVASGEKGVKRARARAIHLSKPVRAVKRKTQSAERAKGGECPLTGK